MPAVTLYLLNAIDFRAYLPHGSVRHASVGCLELTPTDAIGGCYVSGILYETID